MTVALVMAFGAGMSLGACFGVLLAAMAAAAGRADAAREAGAPEPAQRARDGP